MKDSITDTNQKTVANLQRDFEALGQAYDNVYGQQSVAFQEIVESGELDDSPERLEAVTSAMSFADGEIDDEDIEHLRAVSREHDLTASTTFSLGFYPGKDQSSAEAFAKHLTDTHPNLQVSINNDGHSFTLDGLPQDILSAIDYFRYAIMQRDDVQNALKTAYDEGELTEGQYEAFMQECEQAGRELQFLFD